MKNRKFALIILSIIAIASLGYASASAFGEDGLFHILPEPEPLESPDSHSEVTITCDQGATTTPCSEIEDEVETQEPSERSATTDQIKYSPLTEVYTLSSKGFSLSYSKELKIENNGDVILSDRRNEKNFALKICGSGSPCASIYENLNPASRADFEKEVNVSYGESSTYGEMTYKEIPVMNSTFVNANNVTVLKHVAAPRVLDSEGRDITAQVCETCGEEMERYIFFKSPENYVVLWPMTGNSPLLDKIIDSITY